MVGRVVPHSCDNKGISASSWRLASWLGLSLVINLTYENNEEITFGEATCDICTGDMRTALWTLCLDSFKTWLSSK